MKKNDYTQIVRRIEHEGFLCIDNRIKPNTNNYDEFMDASEAGASEAGASEVGASEADASEAGASEADASEAGASEAGANANEIGTFEVGKIMEMTGTCICPGEIVSIMNYEEFNNYKNEIKYYRPVLKGKKVRFYKHAFQEEEQAQVKQEEQQDEEDGVIMSGESVIYPPDEEIPMTDSEIRHQVNYDLMEPNKCYYATITVPEKKVILTYITSIKQPKLELPDLQHDLVFANHIELHECKDKALDTFKQSKEENGLVFYRNDGQPFEFWTPTYSNIKSQEKPYSISTHEYYIMLLNKYPLGNTYERFFEDLHYDVDIYLTHYPEHEKIFAYLRKKLDAYAALDFHNSSDDNLNKYNKYNKYKMLRLTILLNLDKEYDADPKVVVNVITY